ncbi:pantoate--beta-alanine ligase [Flavobacterium akiainvivens]|uniref:Pantothenate synthetase n=1 Tax=Flavobacterium akiainvivens TaxID=1202724 RepID=A0A0M8MKA9_9FLAO|nr:pantoate--beta-alanine ligase [Flavobacterium akiainvivens]KOS07278.1 pantoate--beta-alanine ligase [Flavobacterium akiainvivens]SFQ46105.1 pantothenate synthetase [Flavobacterium akiainvivens]
MPIFTKKDALKAHLQHYRDSGKAIGFVPTMGALHQGHLALVKQSVAQNGATVVSIFVNPTQFNNPDDLLKYPRTLDADVQKIATVHPDVVVFAPEVDEMYDGNTQSKHYDFDGLETKMEGAHRPGHFDGVGTIVKKLFDIVQPTNAYFGEKDFQQLQIVKKLVEKESLGINIVGCPISREESGLAMSSRNERLTEKERKDAAIIYRILQEAREHFKTESIAEVREHALEAFETHPEFKPEYFEIAEESTLETATLKENRKYRAFIAVFLGNVRLIDNISLN